MTIRPQQLVCDVLSHNWCKHSPSPKKKLAGRDICEATMADNLFAECFFAHSAKKLFAACQTKNTRQRGFFAECQKIHSAKRHLAKKPLCRVFFLPSVFCLTLGKELLCIVREKNTQANLGKRLSAVVFT